VAQAIYSVKSPGLVRRVFAANALRSSFGVLATGDKRRLLLVCGVQILLSILDLIGIALLGILGALSISGIQSSNPLPTVEKFVTLLGLKDADFQEQVAYLAIFSAIILIGRTFISGLLTKWTTYFLSKIGARITSKALHSILNKPSINLQHESEQALIFAVSGGMNAVTVGILSATVMLISDFTLLIVLTSGLMFVDFQLALIILLYFSVIAIALYFLMNKKAETLGKLNRELQITVNEQLQTGIRLQKELNLRGKRHDFTEKISDIRYNLAEIEAARAFLPHLTKFIIESSLLLGMLILSAFVFMKNDAIHAASMLTLFLAAALRIAPAILRIQQQTLNIKVSSGIADQALILLQISKQESLALPKKLMSDFRHTGFRGSIRAQNLSFKYPSNDNSSLTNIELDIAEGEFVAIVGPSGAGKTTLLNLILGIIEPTDGSILVSSLKPDEAVTRWPGAIGYVPQEIYIVPSNFPENIAVGFDELEIDQLELERTLKFTQLFDESKGMISTFNSLELSGGQKQRLGIARACYTNPLLLILDESTSALDATSENMINSSLRSLHGKVTVITIAHRLSTVRNADKIVYMDKGKILSIGSFNEVRKAVPDFDSQASLMGL